MTYWKILTLTGELHTHIYTGAHSSSYTLTHTWAHTLTNTLYTPKDTYDFQHTHI